MKKPVIMAGAIILILALTFGLLVSNPPVSCRIDLPEQYLEAIESQAKGKYSDHLPLMPVYISVDHFVEGKVFYTIHYFPFGTVGMSYIEGDGYNIEKPLAGWA